MRMSLWTSSLLMHVQNVIPQSKTRSGSLTRASLPRTTFGMVGTLSRERKIFKLQRSYVLQIAILSSKHPVALVSCCTAIETILARDGTILLQRDTSSSVTCVVTRQLMDCSVLTFLYLCGKNWISYSLYNIARNATATLLQLANNYCATNAHVRACTACIRALR